MKDKIKLSIFWVLSFLVIIFMMPFVSHAETFDNTLPFYFASIDNFNYILNDTMLNTIRNGNLPLDNDDYVLILRDIGYISSTPVGGHRYYNYRFYFDLLPISSFDSYTNDIYTNIIPYTVITDLPKYRFYVAQTYSSVSGLDYSISNTAMGTVSTDFSPVGNIFGHAPTTYTAGFNSSTSPTWTFSANYPAYFSKDFLYNGQTVLYFDGSNSPLDIGVAIIPPDAFIPEYPPGTTPPAQVPPTFTSSDYNWTTPPTFDSSSIEAAIGSIQNTLGWIANNLKEEFKNLTNNLKGFFKYIGDTIQYYGNAIISTLNNFIKNFYDNMKALVEPIFQKIDYITTPLEADIIWDNISGTSLINNYSSIINAASSLKSSFENLSEPTEYKIPIHLENISTFGTLTTQYIDLSVINPVKTIIRTFMWALITYSLVVTIIDSIANYINGGGDES